MLFFLSHVSSCLLLLFVFLGLCALSTVVIRVQQNAANVIFNLATIKFILCANLIHKQSDNWISPCAISIA